MEIEYDPSCYQCRMDAGKAACGVVKDPQEWCRGHLIREIGKLCSSRDFYRYRCGMMQSVQSRMRDPERTIVCDILANCAMLPDPDGIRYGNPDAGAVVVEGWIHPDSLEPRHGSILDPWVALGNAHPAILDVAEGRDQTHFAPVTVTIRRRAEKGEPGQPLPSAQKEGGSDGVRGEG